MKIVDEIAFYLILFDIMKLIVQTKLYTDKNLKDIYNQMIRTSSETERANYKLETKYINDKILLRINLQQPYLDICSWYSQISDIGQCSKVVVNVFTNLLELFEHIQDEENVRVDWKNGMFYILLKTSIKNKQALTEIAEIKMNAIKQPQMQDLTSDKIFQLCKRDTDNISNNLIKKILTFLTIKIEKIGHQPEVNYEQKLTPILDPIINKIKKVGDNTEMLQHKIASIMEELSEIKQNNKKQIGDTTGELKDYIETVKQGIDRQIIRCENKHEIFTMEFRDKIQMVYEEMKNDKFQFKGIKQSIRNMREYISNLQTEIIMQLQSKRQGKIQQKPRQRSSEKKIRKDLIRSSLKYQQPIFEYIDNSTPFFKHFKGQSMEVTKIQRTHGASTLLIGRNSINASSTYALKVKKLGVYPILIGIIDKKHRNQQYCEKNDNRIWFSNDGLMFNGQKQARYEPPFAINSRVEISVNLKEGSIKMSTQKFKSFNFSCNILKKKDIEWYPCIWMGEYEDTIEWIQI